MRQHVFGGEDAKELVINMNEKSRNGQNGPTNQGEDEDAEDIRWARQNVANSLVDAALPVLVDSEDELINSRFERNKME